MLFLVRSVFEQNVVVLLRLVVLVLDWAKLFDSSDP